VRWQKIYHLSGPIPRLVAVQGEAHPSIYRHPADESPPWEPYTPTLQQVHAVVERRLGHPLNHMLIQWYRDGYDRISEHADKTGFSPLAWPRL
jgi:alkylated DNA repair dioxygenase AlkB